MVEERFDPPIDLSQVKTPTYIQAGREDHIAPPASVWKITHYFQGPLRFVLAGSGHIAGVVNPPEAQKYQYWTNDNIRDVKLADPWSIILGADAQTRSWSHVTADFMPFHRGHDAEVYRANRAAHGRDDRARPLRGRGLRPRSPMSPHGVRAEKYVRAGQGALVG